MIWSKTEFVSKCPDPMCKQTNGEHQSFYVRPDLTRGKPPRFSMSKPTPIFLLYKNDKKVQYLYDNNIDRTHCVANRLFRTLLDWLNLSFNRFKFKCKFFLMLMIALSMCVNLFLNIKPFTKKRTKLKSKMQQIKDTK